MPTPIKITPPVVSIEPRPSQVQFSREIRANFLDVKTKLLRKLKSKAIFFNQRASR